MTLTLGVLLGSAIKFLTYLKPQAVSPCCSCNLCPRNMLQCTVRAHLQVIELSANDLIPAGDRIRKIKCAVRWAVARTNASLNQNLPVFAGEKKCRGGTPRICHLSLLSKYFTIPYFPITLFFEDFPHIQTALFTIVASWFIMF